MVKLIDQIDLKGKNVFIRMDYNVSLKDGEIRDDTRICASLPTLKYAIEQKATLILASHLGRPKGEKNNKYSLFPVAKHLSSLLDQEIIFPEDCIGDSVKKLINDQREGGILLLENLRFYKEEETNDPQFSKKLASLADVYINDAFGTMHRAHASTCGMASYFKEKGIGFLVQKEIEFLNPLLHAPQKPFVAALGGAKVSDKLDVIENLMNTVDIFLIGGGMAYTFLKARGVEVGTSLVEETKVHQAERLLKRAEVKGVEICLPIDSIIANKMEENAEYRVALNSDNWGNWMGLDIGPKTLQLFEEKLFKAKTIFWNGPMGVFEIPLFKNGTFELAKMIGASRALSVVGGGDLLTAIKMIGCGNQFSHLSTGGGASMEFLEGKKLPGLGALDI